MQAHAPEFIVRFVNTEVSNMPAVTIQQQLWKDLVAAAEKRRQICIVSIAVPIFLLAFVLSDAMCAAEATDGEFVFVKAGDFKGKVLTYTTSPNKKLSFTFKGH